MKKPRFRPTENKQAQQNKINDILTDAGFAYERNGDYFYSIHNCWQRECGYCRLYDEGCPAFNMIIDCEPVEFTYDGKRWLIELWKGQYGITTGGEIGLYYTTCPDVKSARFTGTFYDAVPDDEMMQMSFVLKKHGRVLLRRSDRHFWLTGFVLGEFSQPSSLTMDAEIVFPSADMAGVFVRALEDVGYTRREYSRSNATVQIHYRHPHNRRNILEKARDKAVQLVNHGNCKLYKSVTAPYPDTLDGLEYLRHLAPHIFDFMLNALYAHAFFELFGWLRELVGFRKPGDPCPGEVLPTPLVPPCPPERPPLIIPIPVCRPRCECPGMPCRPPLPPCPPAPCGPPQEAVVLERPAAAEPPVGPGPYSSGNTAQRRSGRPNRGGRQRP